MSDQPHNDDDQSAEALYLLMLNGGFDPSSMPEREALYRVNRDPEGEKEVAEYVEAESNETVISAQKITAEQVFDTIYTVWDVKTDKRRWWVISNPLSLYPQSRFQSLDYTLSFHVGLTRRLKSNQFVADAPEPDQPDDSYSPDPFDEFSRRHKQAIDQFDRAIDWEDHQIVGEYLRECLIALVVALRRRTGLLIEGGAPADTDVNAWMVLLLCELCPGEGNSVLRQYIRGSTEQTWSLVNWLAQDSSANRTAAKISIDACDALCVHMIRLLTRSKNDNVHACPECGSRDVGTYFDYAIKPDGGYYGGCNSCCWTSHPTGAMPGRDAT